MAVRRMYSVIVLDPSKIRMGENQFQISFPKDRSEFYYLNKAEATDVANDYARHNPTIPVVLMESSEVFETKRPEVMQKVFKENGDLLPK